MKHLIIFCFLIIISCTRSVTDLCDCMENYEIAYSERAQMKQTLECLDSHQVTLSLKNEETGKLIHQLESSCPVGARKLWKLCKDFDEGLIGQKKIDTLDTSIEPETMNAELSNEKQQWERLEKWIADNAPNANFGLNPGASEEDFISLEKLIQHELPEDFKRFYRIHNGQSSEYGVEGLINTELLLSTKQIEEEWQSWKDFIELDLDAKNTKSDPQQGIKDDWWNKLWIPITSEGTGDYTCIDLDPDQGGQKGQIIRMTHDDTFRELFNTSFKNFIEMYIQDLEEGKYVYSEEWGGIIKKEYTV